MVVVDVVLDKNGILKSCKASGHANAGTKGNDMVCLAVSTFLRTAVKVLSDREGIHLKASAPNRGDYRLETDYSAQGKDFLRAAGIFLTEGLVSVSVEYPAHCKINIYETEE